MNIPKETSDQIKLLPKTPGVYFFKDSDGVVLYVGKATSLQDRVRSYWSKELDRGPLIRRMVNMVETIDFRQCDSEMEALILEANLIKHFMPKYNIKLKDDKGFYFVKIFKDVSGQPKVETVHRNEMAQNEREAKYYGPYTSRRSLNIALKFMRRVFPYNLELLNISLTRFNHVGENSDKIFKRNILHIVNLLEGKKDTVIQSLKSDMERLSRQKKFEEASAVRDKFLALQHLKNTANIVDDSLLVKKSKHIDLPNRIEGYDVSNTSGKEPVVSMVVFINGKPKKSLYRKFIIKEIEGPNDTAMLMEAVSRRLRHDEWELPDLILVDGGKGQLNSVQTVLRSNRLAIPLIGMAKGSQRKNEDLYFINDNGFRNINILRAVRDEAHRFAVTFHRQRRAKIFKQSELTNISGIGAITARKLLSFFGSYERVIQASDTELKTIVGSNIAKKIKQI